MAKRYGARVAVGILALFAVLTICFALAVYQALYPFADGNAVLEKSGTTVDYSNADQGYAMVKHTETDKALKMRVSLGEQVYIYDLDRTGAYVTIPFTFGSGDYSFQIFRQVSGKKYSAEASFTVPAEITDNTLPFLYPNQYVWYTGESAAVAKAAQLCEGLETDEDKLAAVRDFVVSNITYDYDLAATVTSGYIPVIDDVLAKGEGICFDYSCLTACMLRTQGVPTELVIGYADQCYHAWNNVLIDGEWLRVDTTVEASNMKASKYVEERIY